MKENEKWLSVEQIAEHLGVSRESIYRWAEGGKIPAHKVGRQWKFRISAVNRWVESGSAGGKELNTNQSYVL